MLDSIYVGMTGLIGYSKGLRVIANNTTNINTPGFKSSNLQFADMFYGGSSNSQSGRTGNGLTTLGTFLNFKAGELRQTGNDLDVALDGKGFFLLQDEQGNITYSRAGQFQFNQDGVLVTRGTAQKVMGLDATGNLVEISIGGKRTNAGNATSIINFGGNLSSTSTTQTVNGVKVIDNAGGEHTLSARLTSDSATTAGAWKVELLDGTTVVGTGRVIFVDGKPTVASSKLSMTYTPAGMSAVALTLDFSSDVTSFASGNLSTLAMSKQDGIAPGALSGVTFDGTGTLSFSYSNGQTTKGSRLALALFDSPDSITAQGGNTFIASNTSQLQIGDGQTKGFGTVNAGSLEISNVDLSQEFSDLVIMQRGYQASSQIISTANEMLQELFAMKK